MATVIEQSVAVPGGGFLLQDCDPAQLFTPEDFSEEHHMIAQTTREFVDNEVRPRIEELENHDWKLSRELLQKCGELGLLGVSIPEAYGGLGLDQTTGLIVSEAMGRVASFAVTFGAQTSIGMLPILYFGSEAVKQKYLPRIASGELVTAYALTEASSGSDALAAKATAKLSADGKSYILNGEKMWITNGGYADMFVVFAKVEGDKFSSFVVERGPGVTNGADEHKMGIKGSSTTAIILADAQVPVENLLGEVGGGAKIAFNILNIGRFKLGASCTGAAKMLVTESVRYANERHQFGKAISSFGAIKHKLAEMAIQCWVSEAATYRTLGLIEAGVSVAAENSAKLKAIEEYAVECSIVKVRGSEACDFVVDEMVQIFGGYGYSTDYPAERAYRDSRINRIFEGTNEINRLLIPGMLLKRAMKGQLGLLKAAQGLMDEVMTPVLAEFDEDDTVLVAELKLARNAKKAALMVLGLAAQKFMTRIDEQQEILTGVADIIIDAYAMESAIVRTQKLLAKQGEQASARFVDITRVYCNDAVARIETCARNTLAAMVEGDELRTMLAALRRFTKHTPINAVAARQRIADVMIAAGKYTY